MKIYDGTDLISATDEVKKSADISPVVVLEHGVPSYVLMSIEDFIRLGGIGLAMTRGKIDDNLLKQIRAIEKKSEHNND